MSCFCPSGYTAAPDNSECIREITASTSGSSSTLIVQKAATSLLNGFMGTIFYEDITNLTFPIKLSGTNSNHQTKNGTLLYNTTFFVDSDTTQTLKNRTLNFTLGGPGAGEFTNVGGITPSLTQNCSTSTNFGPSVWPCGNSNTVWGNRSTGDQGRLNYCGVWPTTTSPAPPFNTWIGFTACFEIPSGQTYFIGLGSDDYYRFKLNNQLIVDATSTGITLDSPWAYSPYGSQFATWQIFPITLPAGTNYIEMEGLSVGANSVFGAEIYSGSVSLLSGVTTQAQLNNYIVFTTRNLIGSTFDNSGNSGLTCPSGYTLVTCSGSPFCAQVLRTPCIGTTTSTSTTTSTTRPYINAGYIPVNDCNVLTISPLNVLCSVTNITGKPDSSNGSITLNITGGVPPYTIRWTYPNGTIRVGGATIGGLSVGSYTALVTDYYGDYSFTTTCTIPGFTTTTTSTTTTPPIPNYLENIFCLSITIKSRKNVPILQQLTFGLNTFINGMVSWITSTGQEIIYFEPSIGTSGVWSLSASTSSILNSPSFFGVNPWQIINSSPIAPIPNVDPNFVGWSVQSTLQTQVVSTLGACDDFLYLSFNEWWGLNGTDIPTTYKFSGGSCTGSNSTPWMKWYLQGGLTSSDISSFEIYCEDLDNPGYVHWDVTSIPNTTTQVSSTIPWPGGVTINSTTGGIGTYNSQGWEGPCPPISSQHTYQIILTANLVAGGTITSSVTFKSST